MSRTGERRFHDIDLCHVLAYAPVGDHIAGQDTMDLSAFGLYKGVWEA